MNKYKVGDKFILEIESIPDDLIVNDISHPYQMKHDSKMRYSEEYLDKLKKIDMTAEEAWKIAREICYNMRTISYAKLRMIFGLPENSVRCNADILRLIAAPQEAKEKIKAWEKSKEEIQVGDVVQNIDNPDVKILITKRYKDETIEGIDGSGATFSGRNKKDWKKTGLHYDIENILKFKEES